MDFIVFSENIQFYVSELLTLLATVYLINLINFILFKKAFCALGIRPRKTIGLIGIPLAPILHGSSDHFFFNAIPFFFISLMMVAILDWDLAFLCIETIALLSGFFTWIAGRRGIHIGASGVVTGMFGWVAYWTFYSPTLVNLGILAVLILYFGSIFLGIVPSEPGVSWEGHLMGLIAGVLCAKFPELVDAYADIRLGLQLNWEALSVHYINYTS